jgi:hypothetical protein
MRTCFGQLKRLYTAIVTPIRFGALTTVSVLSVTLLVCASFSQSNREVYTYNLNFTTQNQCMWQQGTCNVVYNYFLGGNFNSSGSGGGYFTIPVLGEFGASGSAYARGRMGLNFEASATGGNVSVTYPMQLTISFPTRDYLVPGGTVVIQSSYKLQQGARLSTQSPDARVVVSSVIDFTGGFSVQARAFSRNLINESVNIPRINYNQTLVDTNDLNIWDRDFDLISNYPGLLVLNVHYPRILTEGGNPPYVNETRLTSTGSDRFVTLTGDLTAATVYLIQTLLGVPPNNYLRKSVSYGPLEAGYSVLQTEVRTGLGFRQDFEFVPRPKIRLTFSDGRPPVEFYAGESVSLRLPMSGALDVNASVVMDNQFKNITYLTVSGGIYFLPLSVYASGGIGPISLGSFQFKPVDEMGVGATSAHPNLQSHLRAGGVQRANCRRACLPREHRCNARHLLQCELQQPDFRAGGRWRHHGLLGVPPCRLLHQPVARGVSWKLPHDDPHPEYECGERGHPRKPPHAVGQLYSPCGDAW